ncbi:hypothetical protein L6164_005662 [Bauhinia variegata]|uniref:Uncharacterized protein n=1 Tax=Bauhinia variegata TaxID=167791 RepID=A0ACB9PUL9_BAUVA|nr:hypothetical protein L6164_005662 [Bauhinia variegata]
MTHKQTRHSNRLRTASQPDLIAKIEVMAKRKIAYRMVVDFSHYDDMKRIERRNTVNITTTVDGYEFTLTEESLGDILGVPVNGNRIYCSKRWDKKSIGVLFARAMEIIADAPIDSMKTQRPSLRGANSVTKTMGHIVKMAIMPKLGNLSRPSYNKLTAKDTRSQSVLPYGMILSRIFKQHTAIDTTAYSYTPMPRNNVIKKLLASSSSESFQEFLIKCVVSKIDRMAIELDLLKKEVAELKANRTLEKSDSETYSHEDDDFEDVEVDADFEEE